MPCANCGGGSKERDRARGLPSTNAPPCKRPHNRLCKIWHIVTSEPKTPWGDPCVYFPGHLLRKPDPCIYSQFLLIHMQQPVTWDNPDVRILLAGVEQNTHSLTAGTEYDVGVTVHNSSRDKPAIGTSVQLRLILADRHSLLDPIDPGLTVEEIRNRRWHRSPPTGRDP